jgi:hypothetical protein
VSQALAMIHASGELEALIVDLGAGAVDLGARPQASGSLGTA